MPMDHSILESRVQEAVDKIASHGIEGVSEKEVVLACFGLVMFNGLETLNKTIKQSTWTIVGVAISTLIAIIVTLIFI
jgi:hypothetical protein